MSAALVAAAPAALLLALQLQVLRAPAARLGDLLIEPPAIWTSVWQ